METTDGDRPGEERRAAGLHIMPMRRGPHLSDQALHRSLTSWKASTSSSSSLGQLGPELTACCPKLGSPVSVPSGSMSPTGPGLQAPLGSELSKGLSPPTCRAAGVSAVLGAAPPGSPSCPGIQLCQAGCAHGSIAPGSPSRRRGVSCSMVLPRGPRTWAEGHHPAKWKGWQGSCQTKPFPL